jgi:hypothetical protein
MEERRGAYRDLVRKPEGKRPLGKIILEWLLKKYDARPYITVY